MPIWVLATDGVIRVTLFLHVIYRRRPVSVTLAWLVLIALVPIISVVAYLMIGESRLGVHRAKQYEAFTKKLELEALKLWEERGYLATDILGTAQTARLGVTSGSLPAMRGSRLGLIGDDLEMLALLVQDIDAATDHVHIVTYIWTHDAGATRVAEALIRAAKRGVVCRVLVDGVGSWKFIGGPLWCRMREGGVNMLEALPVNWFRRPFARVDLRNHRKIAVIDGRIGYCGSQNIHDTTFRSSKWRRTGPWIDASVRVVGPAAQALGVTFLRDWCLDTSETMTDVARYLPPLEPGAAPDQILQVLPSGPGRTPKAIHEAVLTIIYSAREEVVMTSPYFVPDEALLSALTSAAARGVKVTVVLPHRSDSPLVAAASRSFYVDLLDAGVSIWHHMPGLLHAKTLTMDGKIGLIGSANMDARSFFLNFEATMFVYDNDFTKELLNLQQTYIAKSREIVPKRWHERKWWEVLRDNTVQLLGPLL